MGKIGILGGTFNPIHNGHLMLADAAYKALSLDKVLIMPSGVSYLKDTKEIASKEDRAYMTKLAIEAYPYFEMSDIELKRDGNTYTYETLMYLNENCPDDGFYFIMGADSLYSIESWKNPQIIFDNCTLAVMVRDDVSIDELNDQCAYLTNKYGCRIIIIDIPAVDISSSEIRNAFKSGRGEDVASMLPESVYNYISDYNLYMQQ